MSSGSVTNDDTRANLIERAGTRHTGIGTAPRSGRRAATRRRALTSLREPSGVTTLNGLTPLTTYSVWLVDRSDLIPPSPDALFSLLSFLALGPSTVLTGVLGLNLPLGLTIDRVVVAPGILGGGEPLAAGTVNVFQKRGI